MQWPWSLCVYRSCVTVSNRSESKDCTEPVQLSTDVVDVPVKLETANENGIKTIDLEFLHAADQANVLQHCGNWHLGKVRTTVYGTSRSLPLLLAEMRSSSDAAPEGQIRQHSFNCRFVNYFFACLCRCSKFESETSTRGTHANKTDEKQSQEPSTLWINWWWVAVPIHSAIKL